ncbi:GDSL-type esterase/lipase family protein [Streptosporangium sp. NBC_01639]|uniref:SGNH/GDSL hydrolase family protein n=1 Tax=Streptosporangium sp. NBC_01639 TaxID=2975948 RepID=UPI00386FA637|nr:GDSL-type esterase/lipase family protein [Streptosporangium sp. NBC_01639]
MKKRIVITLCLLLAAVLTGTGAVGYLTFLRPADNPPADACAPGSTPGTRPIVVAAGASMTQGRLGADWVSALRADPRHRGYQFVNAGINGNTTADLRQRVDADVIACHPAAVTLLIGTNDVRNGVPLEQYRDNLRAIVDHVKTRTTAKIALMSLPPLGEDLDATINRTLSGYNAAIKQIAAGAGVAYLPAHERMVDALRQGHGAGPKYAFSFGRALAAAAQHHLLGRSWDQVARYGGRQLLIDDVHLNERAGAIVADLVAHWLSRTPVPTR